MANLTSKELSAIEDTLSVEQNLIKKYGMYAQQSTDKCIQDKCEQIAQKHRTHYNTLMSHLS